MFFVMELLVAPSGIGGMHMHGKQLAFPTVCVSNPAIPRAGKHPALDGNRVGQPANVFTMQSQVAPIEGSDNKIN